MSTFNYNDYSAAVNAAQNKGSNVKVGFFKLADDGDVALVRINLSDMSELQFASVHTIQTGSRKWMKVSCLNPIGSYDKCELCAAVDAGDKRISKASKKVYVLMNVSYQDRTTGTWSATTPVVWERPAGFSKELANKLRDYGDLKTVLLKVTRNGAAGDMKTTYSMDYAVPTVYKPEMVSDDFSAFNNFKVNKHSYWEKTPEEIHEFITTGEFPEVVSANTKPATTSSVASTAAAFGQTNATTSAYGAPFKPATAYSTAPETVTTPATETVKPAATETVTPVSRDFNGFSF